MCANARDVALQICPGLSSPATLGRDVLTVGRNTNLRYLPLYDTTLRPVCYCSCHCQNVTSSSTAVASLEAARDSKSPIILQMSQGGAAYFCGKVVACK